MPLSLLLSCLTSYASLCLYTSPLLRHTLFSFFLFSSLVCHPEFFICTSSASSLITHSNLLSFYHLFAPLSSSPSPCSSASFLPLYHIFFTIPSSIPFLFLPTPLPVVPQLSGHLVPPHLPTTSAALPCQTVPTSPEGWASAAHSTQASSGVLGTSRAPPTLAGLRPRHCHMAIARPGGHMVLQGFSASSHPSLYAGEWKRGRSMGKQEFRLIQITLITQVSSQTGEDEATWWMQRNCGSNSLSAYSRPTLQHKYSLELFLSTEVSARNRKWLGLRYKPFHVLISCEKRYTTCPCPHWFSEYSFNGVDLISSLSLDLCRHLTLKGRGKGTAASGL